MTSAQLKAEGQDWLRHKYTGYDKLPGRERRILAAAWLCDVVKPREQTGSNDGPVVEAILKNVGLGKGFAWCAAAQALIADVAKGWRPEEGAAGVMNWVRAARNVGRSKSVKNVVRGDLVAKGYGKGMGHIGIVIKRVGPVLWSIEGNTGPGEEGNQREGQGMYRRARMAWFWDYGIDGQ